MAKTDDSATSFAPAVGEAGANAAQPQNKTDPAQKAPKIGNVAPKQTTTGSPPLDALANYYAQAGGTTTQAPAGNVSGAAKVESPKVTNAGAQQVAVNANLTNRNVKTNDDLAPQKIDPRLADSDALKALQAQGAPQAGTPAGQVANNALQHHDDFHVNKAHGWGAGPTGYVGFDQSFGDNAATANRSANDLAARVKGDADKAKQHLADRQSQYTRDLGNYSKAAGDPGHEWGDDAPQFNAGDLTNEFSNAQSEVGNLGKGAGGVQGLYEGNGQRMGRFGAGLTAAAGQSKFGRLGEDYAGLGTSLSDAGKKASLDATAAHTQSDQDRAGAESPANAAPHEDAGLADAEAFAKSNGYPNLDAMLQESYATEQTAGDFSGSYEDYKQKWLEDRAQRAHASARAEPG